MNSGAIASRYAKSFFEFCVEQGEIENVYPFVKHLIDILSSQVKLRELIADKTLTDNEKINLIERVAGKSLPQPLKEFINLIVRKSRTDLLLQIFLIFRSIYLKSKNILDVELLLADELNASALENIITRVAETLGNPCEISITVKPELIAGYILIVNGKVFDSSVRGQLNTVKKNLLEKKFDNL
ncbi:MAG: ATP synthase F1 subunit delta [Bacteroidota bacterium]